MSAVILIGASGAGKTAIVRAIARRLPDALDVFSFDDIGVPKADVMIRDYGSGEAWQRAKTIEWMAALANIARTGRKLVFEGQTRLSFLAEGAAACGWMDYRPILVDCDDATRATRLTVDRRQPELATLEMMNWAHYLRVDAKAHGCDMLDTSAISLDEAVSYVVKRL